MKGIDERARRVSADALLRALDAQKRMLTLESDLAALRASYDRLWALVAPDDESC